MSAAQPIPGQAVRCACPPKGITVPVADGTLLAAVLQGHVFAETPGEILPAGTGSLLRTDQQAQFWSLDGGEICYAVLPAGAAGSPGGLHAVSPAPADFQALVLLMDRLDSPDRLAQLQTLLSVQQTTAGR